MQESVRRTNNSPCESVIVVLGSTTAKTRTDRVTAAVTLFNTLTSERYSDFLQETVIMTRIIFSGGTTRPNFESEADAMMKTAIEMGVDKKFLVTENKSRNTMENLIFSKKIIQSLYHYSDNFPNVIICTSTFHIKRTFVMAHVFMKEHRLSFIHTNEEIPHDKAKQEAFSLDQFLTYQLKL
jgi:uncharacterized SAM-binding protein YcdF (DUF218 family)